MARVGEARLGATAQQVVGAVALGAVGVACPLVQVVGPALAHDFLHGVAGVGEGLVLRGAGEVVAEAGERALGAVAVAGGGDVEGLSSRNGRIVW